MASVTLDAHFRSINGRVGNYLFYSSYDRQFVRSYIIPRNPDTEKQRMVRKTFAGAVRSWQGLTDEERNKFNKKARRLPLSGYNLYISGYMKENISIKKLKRGKSILFITPGSLLDKGLIRDSSVTTAYRQGDCSYSTKYGQCKVPV